MANGDFVRVSHLRIRNFRGIKSGEVSFGHHTVLVGPNNCGKTTVIEALALVFGRDRMVRDLTEHDFYGSDPSERDRIQLVATITGFESNQIENHPAWFSPDRAIPKWINPNSKAPSINRESAKSELCAQIGFAARFDREELQVETMRYFVDSDDGLEDIFNEQRFQSAPWEAIKEFGFFLISGSRTWDRMMSFASELFRRVVTTVGSLPATAVLAERDRVRNPPKSIEKESGLSDVFENANLELSKLVIDSPTLGLNLTSTDSKGILDALTPHFKDKAGNSVPASRQGTGILSLQSLLLLLQFGKLRSESDQGFCLAVEEPELHIPPAQQRRLINRLHALCTQTIASSHSSAVASMYPTQSVVFLKNTQGNLEANPLTEKPLDSKTTNPVQKLFFVKRTETIAALMHQVVLIPEGRTEFGWLTYLSTAVELEEPWNSDKGDSLDFGSLVGLIPTNDSHVIQTFEALKKAHSNVFCLVDGDAQGQLYIEQLKALHPSPKVVITWPNDWAIENVIGWIVEADLETLLPN